MIGRQHFHSFYEWLFLSVCQATDSLSEKIQKYTVVPWKIRFRKCLNLITLGPRKHKFLQEPREVIIEWIRINRETTTALKSKTFSFKMASFCILGSFKYQNKHFCIFLNTGEINISIQICSKSLVHTLDWLLHNKMHGHCGGLIPKVKQDLILFR